MTFLRVDLHTLMDSIKFLIKRMKLAGTVEPRLSGPRLS